MKKVGIVSLGCPKNTVDSELVLGDLSGHGYEITPHQEEAEIIIVNTCGFIGPAKQESINAILDMARLKTEGNCRQLVVTGCLSERYSEELLKEIPEIDHMLGVNQYPRLKEILQQSEPGAEQAVEKNHVGDPWEHYTSHTNRLLTTPSYTAYVKIGEGCSNKCSFCIIPKMRGPFRSRPLESILEETRQLAGRGVKEFNLISQDTTMYGFDLRMKDGLTRLLRSMAGINGVEWMRLLYCYPTFITSEMIETIRDEETVCNYIDVPLQHTHDEMLKKMRRQETEQQVRKILDEARSKIPGLALRTTFLVGFPGETDAHFQHMAGFLKDIEFDHVGIFTYSNEEGTEAYNYPDRVPEEVAIERKEELMRLQQEISLRKNHDRIGQIFPILVEGADAEEEFLVTGRLPTQAPQIDGQVIIEKSDVQPGQIVPMRVTEALEYDLIATAIDQAAEHPTLTLETPHGT